MRLAEPDNVVNCLCLNEAALHYILINDLLCREFSESWWECFWQHYLDWICKDIIQAVIVSFSSPLFYLSKTTVIYFCKAIRIYYMCLALLNIVLHRRTAFWPCIIMFVFQGNCFHAKTNVLKEKVIKLFLNELGETVTFSLPGAKICILILVLFTLVMYLYDGYWVYFILI